MWPWLLGSRPISCAVSLKKGLKDEILGALISDHPFYFMGCLFLSFFYRALRGTGRCCILCRAYRLLHGQSEQRYLSPLEPWMVWRGAVSFFSKADRRCQSAPSFLR